MVRRAPAVKEGQGGPNRLASSPGSPISSPSNNRPREREVGDPSKIREWEVYWETTNLLSTHNANLSPWINESNHNCSCHRLMIINAAILAEILDVVIISYTSQHPECFCQVIRYAIWSETLRRLGLITKSKKLLPGFCLSGSFHCDPIHRKKKRRAFSKCVRYASRSPGCRDKPICFFQRRHVKLQLSHLTLIFLLFPSPIPFLPPFTVNFLTFLLIQITEVIYMLTALSCFSLSLSFSHLPSLFSSSCR